MYVAIKYRISLLTSYNEACTHIGDVNKFDLTPSLLSTMYSNLILFKVNIIFIDR